MESLFITYASDSPEGMSIIDELRSACDEIHCTAAVKKALESSIPDLAAAAILVFGVQKTGQSELPADFSRLAEAMKGANFAGKTAAFISFGGNGASARLRIILRDTDIAQFDEEPVFASPGSARTANLREWVKKLMTFHQGNHGAGK